ncbi:hypothetical protein TIFTF001_031742 [Ficus carica]|uniref:Uncharacterized protein n=1 Tax=Ficus carica TaxID=3494 RepID=A0AA88E1Y5_FICCA|nr:hypothetical protein TIFTF001_031742 [Ficus carica]
MGLSRHVAREEWRSSYKAVDAWAPRGRWDGAVTRVWKETHAGGGRACQARVGEGAAGAHGCRRRHVSWVVGARLNSARCRWLGLMDMSGGQEKLAQQSAITSIRNSKQKVGTLIKNHMFMLMGFFTEAVKNGAEVDYNTQIKMVFKTLSKDFVSFKDAYNLDNKELGLTELIDY